MHSVRSSVPCVGACMRVSPYACACVWCVRCVAGLGESMRACLRACGRVCVCACVRCVHASPAHARPVSMRAYIRKKARRPSHRGKLTGRYRQRCTSIHTCTSMNVHTRAHTHECTHAAHSRHQRPQGNMLTRAHTRTRAHECMRTAHACTCARTSRWRRCDSWSCCARSRTKISYTCACVHACVRARKCACVHSGAV